MVTIDIIGISMVTIEYISVWQRNYNI